MLQTIGLKDVLRPTPPVRALLLLSLVMILATIISAAAVLFDLRQKELAHARGEIVSLTRILSDQTTRTFDSVVLTMRGTQERLSDKFGSTLDLDSEPVQLLLRARVAGLPQVKSIFLVDSRGFGVNSSRPDFIKQLSIVEREFFRYFADGGRDEVFISSPERAQVDGQQTYYVSMALRDPAGAFRGVVVASINVDYFELLYESIGLDFVSRILLFNPQGALLAGKRSADAGSANPGALAELRAQPADGVVIAVEASAEGANYVAYRQVAKYPLVISAAVNEKGALTPWYRVMRPIVAGVILVVLFTFSITFLMVRSLLRKNVLEATLKERDEQLRHMVQSVRDAIVTVNSEKRIVLFNGAAERMFDVPADAAIGSNVDALLARCLCPEQLTSLQRYLDEGWRSPVGLALFGIIELEHDAQAFPVELSLSTTMFRGEILLTAVFRDLSERQRAERELRETNRQLQELSASLQNVREEERARISRELHDELGQQLTGIRMEVSWLGGRLLPEQQVLIDKISAVKGQIDQTVVSVRRISSELRPLVLDDLGFSAAAGWYVDQFSARTGLPVTLLLADEDPERGDAVATALFRVLQESLTNVARHATATKVDVRLALQDDQWLLSVRDDGVGFVPDSARHAGLGLVGMRERVQILGGRFFVTTSPGVGVLIEVAIPAGKNKEDESWKR